MVFMPPGAAKALALDTPIPTPDGWRAMGSLKVGDQVFGDDGRPCTVTWVSPVWRDRPVYRVRTDCGDEVIADRDHEWLVRLCGKRQVFKIKETWELHRKRSKRPMIQRADALSLPDVDLPIDPYVLGCWLGDGHAAGGRMTASDDDRAWYREEFARLGYSTAWTKGYSFSVHDIRGALVRLGLLSEPKKGAHGHKHIPQAYLRASEAQRLALLQGLIDTDGTVCRRKGSATFCNTNLELAEGVRELVRSLGRKAGWTEGRATLNGKDCGPVYRVSFYHAEAARLPRKRALCREQGRTPNTYIEVEPAGLADTVCIEVDSPTHLFLCGRSMTPTHNSTYTSRLFPPWYMAQDAGKSIITASHTAELAERWGRSVRNLVHEFGPTLGYGIAKDNQAAGRWATTQGGEYLAAGVGGAIAGFRADLGLIDDPVRSAEDAESERIRDRTWDWYRTDFVTRLKPGAAVVLVQTRWHEDDLAGRILAAEGDKADGGQWRVIRLPAIAELLDPLGREPGAALWPEWEPLDQLERKRATVGPRIWSALYQQRPTAEDGTYFKKEWFRRYTSAPKRDELQVYMSGDFAVTEGGGDFTELAIWGVDSQHNVYALDWWSGQASSDRWLGEFMRLVRQWRPIAFAGEGGPIRRAMEPQINLAMREANTYTVLDWAGSGGDKAANARSFQAQQANGRIYWPSTDWAERVIDQCLRFPAGKHDDAVDTCGLFGRYIDKTWAALPKAPPKPDLAAAMAAAPRVADFLPTTSSPSW